MNRDDAALHPVEALSALLDGEVGAAERRELETHLEACAVCRATLEDLKTIDRGVTDESIPPTPADLARRIAAALPRTEVATTVPGRRPLYRAPMPLAAAASLVVATLIWLAWPGGRPDRGTTSAPVRMSEADGTATPVPLAPPSPEPPAAAMGDLARQGGTATPEPVVPRQERLDEEARRTAPLPGLSDRPATPGATSGKRDHASLPQAKQAPAEAPEATVATSKEELKENGAAGAHEPARAATPAPAAAGAPAAALGGSRGYAEVLTLAPGVSAADLPALRAEPYAVRLLPANAMRVESGAYACTVTLAPEDALLLAEQYAAMQPARSAQSAASAGPVAAGAPSAVAPPAADKDLRARASKSAAAGAGVAILEATPEARALILMLVGERYRAAIEERCGPLPR